MSPNPPVATDLVPFIGALVAVHSTMTTGAVNDSQVVTALTGGAAPPPPNGAPYAASGLTATGGDGQVTLSWTAGSGATSYNLYRSAASGFENSNAAPVVTGITGTSYTNTSLNSGTTYYYQVVATNSSGPSGFSAEAHATTSGLTDTAQFNFETGTQGWSGGGGIISGVATSTAQHFAGNQSLAVNFNGAASGTVVCVRGQRGRRSGLDDYLPCLDSERQQGQQRSSPTFRTTTGHGAAVGMEVSPPTPGTQLP